MKFFYFFKKNISKKIFYFSKIFTLFAISFYFNHDSLADLIRATTFDDRPACEASNGTWRDFGNICADRCEPKFEKYPICSSGINFSCDCGKNRCLHEDKCITIEEYKKIYQDKLKLEAKNLKESKKKREKIAKKFHNDNLARLSGIFGADPNYRDPNRPAYERPLPPNSFKSTNRMIIYNDVILKKKNERILAIQKKYENEINKLDGNNPDEALKKSELQKKLAELKILNPIDTEGNLISSNHNNNNSKKPNQPIVLQPINDNNAVEPWDSNKGLINIGNNISNVLSPKEIAKRANEIMNGNVDKKTDSTQIDNKNNTNDSKNIANKNIANKNIDEELQQSKAENDSQGLKNQSSKDNLSNENIPPVYIKNQNGDEDFKNRDVINNVDDIPQFTN